MTGREETNAKFDGYTNRKLAELPNIVSDFSISFGGKTAATKYRYICYVGEFLDFVRRTCPDVVIEDGNSYVAVKPSDINRFIEETKFKIVNGEKKPTSSSIQVCKFSAVKMFFEFLIDEYDLSRNPCDRARKPVVHDEREVVAMTEDEIRRVEDHIMHYNSKDFVNRDLCIFKMGCTMGLRVTSITEINLEDIDLNERRVKVVEKGNKVRDCYFGTNVKDAICRWMIDRKRILERMGLEGKTDALFVNRFGGRESSGAIRDMISAATVDLDKHITPHKMRSTAATLLYDKTGDIYLVAEVLGHKNLANTRRYTKISRDHKEAAASVMDVIV